MTNKHYFAALFLLHLGVISKTMEVRCPYGGLLVLRPLDPFIAVGTKSRLCCRTINHELSGTASPPPSNLVFDCGNRRNTAISPVTVTYDINNTASTAGSDTDHSVCAHVSVPDLENIGFCRCKVPGHPKCQASQYVSVDASLQSPLTITCVAYPRNNNINCIPDLPPFLHTDRVRSTIKWKNEKGVSENTKLCSKFNSCVLTQQDGMLVNMPLRQIKYYISIETTYDPWKGYSHTPGQKVISVSSNWITFDLLSNVSRPRPISRPL